MAFFLSLAVGKQRGFFRRAISFDFECTSGGGGVSFNRKNVSQLVLAVTDTVLIPHGESRDARKAVSVGESPAGVTRSEVTIFS